MKIFLSRYFSTNVSRDCS